MVLYDLYIPIHETEDSLPPICEMIERLGEMLEQYKIAHCLVLPNTEELKADSMLAYKLYYLQEQDMEFTLVVSLFIRLYLKKDKQQLLECIIKILAKY